MEYCKVKKLINKDINNICFALSNPNKYDTTSTYENINVVKSKAETLAGTMKSNIEYIVKIGNSMVNLWVEAEKDNTISNNIVKYGKHKYLAAVLLYFNAGYSNIRITNNVDTKKHSQIIQADTNILEHRVSGTESKINSYQLAFAYKVDCYGYLLKSGWIVSYDFLQSETIQQDFIDACKSSWVSNVLAAIK